MIKSELEALRDFVLRTTLPTLPMMSQSLLSCAASARPSYRDSVLLAVKELDQIQGSIDAMTAHLQTLRVNLSTHRAHALNVLSPITALPLELLHDIFHRAVRSSSDSPLDVARSISQASSLFRVVSLQQKELWNNIEIKMLEPKTPFLFRSRALPLAQIEAAISRSEGNERSLTIRSDGLMNIFMNIVKRPAFCASLTSLHLGIDLGGVVRPLLFHTLLDGSFPSLKNLSVERSGLGDVDLIARSSDTTLFHAFPPPDKMPQLHTLRLCMMYLSDSLPILTPLKTIEFNGIDVTSYLHILPETLETLIIEKCICTISESAFEHAILPALRTLVVSDMSSDPDLDDPCGLPIQAPALKHLTIRWGPIWGGLSFIASSLEIETLCLEDAAHGVRKTLSRLTANPFSYLQELRVEVSSDDLEQNSMTDNLSESLKMFLDNITMWRNHAPGRLREMRGLDPSSNARAPPCLRRLIIPPELMQYNYREYAEELIG